MALVDTSILVRTEDLNSPDRPACMEALRHLQAKGLADICAQVLIEFWSAATRPLTSNGLGFAPAEADTAVGKLLAALNLLPEPEDMAVRWRALASACRVSGRQVHDCRIAALMLAHGVREVVTLNGPDFSRYPGIVDVHPKDATTVFG